MVDEKEFVAKLRGFFASRDRRVEVGIGDDAAIVRTRSRTVVTCDPVVEGVHFVRGAPLARVGRKAICRNLSDLAAMGATPDCAVASVLLPRWVDRAGRRRLFEGLRDASRAHACPVVGGDCAGTAGPLTITVTVLGHLESKPMLRSALALGDTLHVTGALGGSLLGHHLRFAPRLAEGRWLSARAGVRCAIDLSDGLAIDLWALLAASRIRGAVLDERAIPVAAAAVRSARTSGVSALEHALFDGEDYELLFAVRAGRRLPRGGPLAVVARSPIGVVDGGPGLRLRGADGRIRALPVRGYSHEL